MSTPFNLSDQEICILISSMQCMTKHDERHAGPTEVVSNLYNKLNYLLGQSKKGNKQDNKIRKIGNKVLKDSVKEIERFI